MQKLQRTFSPSAMRVETKVPDATPGIIAKYALSDAQVLLAKLRYNHLIDIFTGVPSYSLQSHFNATVAKVGQIEADEIYLGLDRKGTHYVFPVHVKRGRAKLMIAQIEQGFAICALKFPAFICRPFAVQFVTEDIIALFDFEKNKDGIFIYDEKHYRLVPPYELI
ncbi:MAG: hypothetical protein ILNGONEN_00430 [Syntrophorhabdaceae bacterium]|nr:hypothetical protein [Syntrophorhabdaceae bacterium]